MKLEMCENSFTYVTQTGKIHELKPNGIKKEDMYNFLSLCLYRDYLVIEHDGKKDDRSSWNVLMSLPRNLSLNQEQIASKWLQEKKNFESFSVQSLGENCYYPHFTKGDGYYQADYEYLGPLNENIVQCLFSSKYIFCLDYSTYTSIDNMAKVTSNVSRLFGIESHNIQDIIKYFMQNDGLVITRAPDDDLKRVVYLPNKTTDLERLYLSFFFNQRLIKYVINDSEHLDVVLPKAEKENINLSTSNEQVLALRPNKLL